MINLNCWCVNTQDCKHHNKNFILEFDGERKDIKSEDLICPLCEGEIKIMGEIPAGGYGRFSSLSSSEKSKVLQARSKAHFKTKKMKEEWQHKFMNIKPTM